MDEAADRIISLDQTEDFEVAHDEPDVRGWDVFAADGRRIGKVADLLIDADAMKVRYLDVSVEAEYFRGEGGHRILVPIGYARLDEGDGTIEVATLQSGRVRELPEYDDGDLTERFAEDLEVHFAAGEPIEPPPEEAAPVRNANVEERVDEWVDEARLVAEPTPAEGKRVGPLSGRGSGPPSGEEVEGNSNSSRLGGSDQSAPGGETLRGAEQGHASRVLEDGPLGDASAEDQGRYRSSEPDL